MRYLRQPASVAATLVLALTLGTSVAGAQTAANSAAAQALFDRGKALMNAGRAAEACPQFEESQRLDPGSGTLINLALCYEQTGRTASAWTTYREAAAAAQTAGNVEREKGARQRAAALAPRVSKLVIDVPSESRLPGLVVTRDGVEVGTAQWGVPIPTDKGSHEFLARAPGHVDWHTTVELADGGATQTIEVPKLVEAAAPGPEPVTPVPVATPVVAPAAASVQEPRANESPATSSSSGLGGQRTAALVVGGVGVAGLAVGTVFGVIAIWDKHIADQACDGTACTSSGGVTAGKDAQSAANVSTVAMIVGAVGVAGGTILWLTAPHRTPAAVGIGPSGIAVRGSF
jgi:serine/threonine-protein kinase